MKKIFSLLVISLIAFSQLKIVSTKIIKPQQEAFYPVFDKTSTAIFYTTPNCVGIYRINLITNKIDEITNEVGAGYEFKITDDDKIIYRSDVYENGLKFSSLKVKDIVKNNTKTIVEKQRFVSTPDIPKKDFIVYNIGNTNKIYSIASSKLQRAITSTYVMNEDLKIALYNNGRKKILQPVGEDHYIWISLSPDKKYILFTASTKGTYITDLNGKIIHKIGNAQSPKWSNDGKKIIYMIQKDDGHRYTHSDIYYYDLNEEKNYQLTFTDDVIELYPSWSKDDKQVVCNTEKGEIIIFQLNNSK